MTPVVISSLDNPVIGADVAHKRASLWILPGNDLVALTKLAALQWANVWNFSGPSDFAELSRTAQSIREPLVVSDPEADPESFQSTLYVRIYQLPPALQSKLSPALRRMRAEQLKLRASNIGGTLFVFGDIDAQWEEIQLIAEIGTQLRVCLVPATNTTMHMPELPREIFLWSPGPKAFYTAFADRSGPNVLSDTLDLKDARGVEVPRSLFEEIGPDWKLITGRDATPDKITQENFDRFLNGEPAWTVYAARGAYTRPARVDGLDSSAVQVDLDKLILDLIRGLDESEVDPRDALRQIIIFAEPGSGATTLVRQLAMSVAQAGFPTLISNPLPKNLAVRSLGRVVGCGGSGFLDSGLS